MSTAQMAPLPRPDRRARRKAETRERLLLAARRLFVERGYHDTRPQDIARAADLATGTFYTHFADKREAYLAFVAEAGNELFARIAARPPAGNFKEGLVSSLHSLLEYVDENPGVMRVAFADPAMIDTDCAPIQGMRERLAEGLALALSSSMSEGQLRTDFDPHLIAHGIVGLIHQALVYGGNHAIARETMVEQVTRFCELALVPQQPARTEDPA